MNKNEIIQIQGMEYKEMTKQLLNECALATLIPSKVSLIGIKPNLVASWIRLQKREMFPWLRSQRNG